MGVYKKTNHKSQAGRKKLTDLVRAKQRIAKYEDCLSIPVWSFNPDGSDYEKSEIDALETVSEVGHVKDNCTKGNGLPV